ERFHRLKELFFTPFDTVVQVRKDVIASVVLLCEATAGQLLANVNREMGEHKCEAFLDRALTGSGQAEDGGGIDAADAVKIEHGKAKGSQFGALNSLANVVEKGVSGAKEDVALQLQHINLHAFLSKEALM